MGRNGNQRVSDTEIRTKVRAAIARHRLDAQRLTVRIAGGTVRVGGNLAWANGRRDEVPVSIPEAFERDLSLTRGVRRLFFELADWRHPGPGEWVRTPKTRRRGPVPEEGAVVGDPAPVTGAV